MRFINHLLKLVSLKVMRLILLGMSLMAHYPQLAYSQNLLINQISPNPNQNNISRDTRFEITFSQNIDPISLTDKPILLIGEQKGIIPSSIQLRNQNQIIFRPDAPLPSGDIIHLTVSGQIQSLQGDTLARSQIYEFRTALSPAPSNPPMFDLFSIEMDGGGFSVFPTDLDQDGDLDILSAIQSSNAIVWHENLDGKGNFAPAQFINDPGEKLTDIYATDLDKDGDIDIVAAFENQITWFPNQGDGRFGDPIFIAEALGLISIYAADLDNDGDKDLISAVSGSTSSSIRWYRNNGQASFQAAINIDFNLARDTNIDLTTADIDDDQDLDIILSAAENRQIIWLENTDSRGNFAINKTRNLFDPRSVQVADLDNDQDLDILVTSFFGDRVLWYEKQDTSFTERLISGIPRVRSVYPADMDGDGDLDVIGISQSNQTIFWHQNQSNQGVGGSNTFNPEPRFIAEANDGVNALYATDLDGDGDLDVLSASSSNPSIAWYRNKTNFSIQSIDPASQSLAAEPDANIRIQFSEAVNPNTVNDSSVYVWSTQRGRLRGSLRVQGSEVIFDPETNLISGEVIQMTITNAIQATLGEELIQAYSFEFRVKVDLVSQPQLTFSEEIINANSINASSVYAADLDGDGDLDIIAASQGDNTLAWYQYQEDQTFDSLNISTNAPGIEQIYVGDLNNDGRLDILGASNSRVNGGIFWYAQGENLSFTRQTIDGFAEVARSVHASDIDQDGDLDVFSAASTLGVISWYENLGNGQFSNPISITSTPTLGAESVFTGDVDNDGDLDLISASPGNSANNLGGQIIIFENDSLRAFNNQQFVDGAQGTESLYAIDMNQDGKTDIVASFVSNSQIVWYLTDSLNESFSPNIVNNVFDDPINIYAADMDGDQDVDILAAFLGDRLAWFENLGNNNFDPHLLTESTETSLNIYAADIDGDRDMDIIAASSSNNTIRLFRNISPRDTLKVTSVSPAPNSIRVEKNPTFRFSFSQILDPNSINNNSVQILGSQSGLIRGNFDVNGSILIFSPNTPLKAGEIIQINLSPQIRSNLGLSLLKPRAYEFRVLVDSSLPLFQENNIDTAAFDALDVWVADINQDGNLDIISASGESGTLAWYDGNNTFNKTIISQQANQARRIYIADVNQDQNLELVSASAGNNKIAWYPNDGNENFGEDAISINTQGAEDVFVIDLDNDGDVDVLSASAQGLSWHQNDGQQNFETSVIDFSDSPMLSVYAIDLDSDGDVDIIAASQNQINYYENNGAQVFQKNLISDLNVNITSIYAIDLDQDALVDLLASTQGNNSVIWFRNTGNQSFAQELIINEANGISSIYPVDVDGDTDLDIVAGLRLNNQIAWYENQDQTFRKRLISELAEGVSAVYAADIDNDEDMDIVAALSLSNRVVWYENLNLFPAPFDLKACTDNTDQVSLNWQIDAQVPVQGFTLERASNADFNNPETFSLTADRFSFTDTELSENQLYYYRIQSTLNNLESAYSETSVISTFFPPGSGNALSFDGLDDYVSLNNRLDSIAQFNQGSVTGWFKTASANEQILLSLSNNIATVQDDFIGLGLNAYQRVNGLENASFWFVQSQPNGFFAMFVDKGTGFYADNRWHHFAITLGGNNRMYIDGQEIIGSELKFIEGNQNTILRPNFSPLSQARIGNARIANENTAHFSGSLDEIVLWRNTISQNQIRSFMCQKILCENNPNLIAYWRFDEGFGSVLSDRVGNHTGILQNFNQNNTLGRVLSGAPIGDISVFTYDLPLDLTYQNLQNQESYRLNNVSSSAQGIHLYYVGESPNSTRTALSCTRLEPSQYIGTFIVSPENEARNFDLTYNYSDNQAANLGQEEGLNLSQRSNNSDTVWASLNANLAIENNELRVQALNRGEFILSAEPFACLEASNLSGCTPFTFNINSCTQGADREFYIFEEGGDTSTIPSFTYELPGIYTVKQIIEACGKFDTSEIQVEVANDLTLQDPPRIETTSPVLCPGNTVTLRISAQNNVAYEWRELNQNDILGTDSLLEIREPGSYQVKLTNACGSQDSEILEIFPVDIQIPNLFTPNQDGLNDRFIVHPSDLNEVEAIDLQIFDRQGNKVFATQDIQEATDESRGWDGSDNPNGTYAWTLKIRFRNCPGFSRKGRINLLR